MITTPEYLQKGDRIGVVAPARFVAPDEIEPALRHLESWGLEVIRGENLYARHHQFAGTDQQRAADLQAMVDNDSIRAIICARGGYGTLRIIDQLDFRRLASHPKWIIGYSDTTVLHAHIEKQLGIETLHGPMLLGFDGSPERLASFESLRKALFGESLEYIVPTGKYYRSGTAHAPIIGGNLSLLYALAGSVSEPDTTDKILFIEDVDEYLYHIDRMMQQMKRSGKLEKLAGMVVGGMSNMRDNSIPFGKTAQEIIIEVVKEYDFPVLMGFPAGHEVLNLALIFGRAINLRVSKTESVMQFAEKPSGSGGWLKGMKSFKGLIFISILFAFIYALYYAVIKFILK